MKSRDHAATGDKQPMLAVHVQNRVLLAARTALTEVMKLRQLTSGFAYTDTGIIQIGQSKVKELKELLEEIGNHQVITNMKLSNS